MLRTHYADYEALRAHGEETYPHECCGVLLGNSDAATGKSRAPDRPRRQYPHRLAP